jgi:lipopolysaccharide transport system permease protein
MISQAGAAAEAPSSILIAPSRGPVRLNLRELWSYRELAYFFVWRDVKVRYKQTVFGVLWAVIQPLLLTIVFSLFLGRLSGIAPAGIPYPLFAFAALVPWTLFSKSVVAASDSLVGASNLIQKVYFPRLLLPLAALGAQLLDFLIATIVLLGLMFYFGYAPTLAIVWIVPLTALLLSVAMAAGVWLSAVNVRYRDVRHVVPILVQAWLFASPVAYSAEVVPAQWAWIYQLNPMTGIIEGFRWAVLGIGQPPITAILFSAVITVFVLVSGLAYFRRVESTFADVI